MSDLVSILIPAYNAEKWIADTLQSAISQDWQRKEVIVVDDGSTDSTLSVARIFESKFVKVVTQENCGAQLEIGPCRLRRETTFNGLMPTTCSHPIRSHDNFATQKLAPVVACYYRRPSVSST